MTNARRRHIEVDLGPGPADAPPVDARPERPLLGMSARGQRHERSLLSQAPGVTDDALRRAILDLGLEDDISLWEITDTCKAAGVIADGPPGVEALAETLLDLASRDEIRILVGRWDDPEPRYADGDELETLLADARGYSSADEIAHDLERGCFVNVENIAE